MRNYYWEGTNLFFLFTKMKLKYRHNKTIGKVKIVDKEIIRMLKIGATFELTPAYTEYFTGDGKTIKKKLNHLSLRLKK